MQSSNAEQLLACQAQNQPKNALSLPPPFVGGFLVAGSGTVPNPALELPLWRGLVAGGFRVCPRSRADSPLGRGGCVPCWRPLRPDSPRARARLPSEFPFACNLPLFICLPPSYTMDILERLARERHPSFRGGRRRCKVSHKHSGKRTARTNGISGERS